MLEKDQSTAHLFTLITDYCQTSRAIERGEGKIAPGPPDGASQASGLRTFNGRGSERSLSRAVGRTQDSM